MKVKFPEAVRSRSASVTIYRGRNRRKPAFTVAFYDAAGQRYRRMFNGYDRAKKFANQIREAGEVDLRARSPTRDPCRHQLAVAVAITLFGPGSPAALATVVGVLVEVPVMHSVCRICNFSRDWYSRSLVSEGRS